MYKFLIYCRVIIAVRRRFIPGMGEKMKHTCMHLSDWTGDEERMHANVFGLQAKVDGILEDTCELVAKLCTVIVP